MGGRNNTCLAQDMKTVFVAKLETLIYVIRGQKVMLDYDLADLYGVETRALKQAVKRNLKRFPPDFILQLTEIEEKNLRSQFVISSFEHGGRRHNLAAFTELGIAMLSSVLKSEQAIQVNISIMRAFFELRHFLKEHETLSDKLQQIEKNSDKLFKLVFERLDTLESDLHPLPPKRRKIGI
jgi:hypothetical protein